MGGGELRRGALAALVVWVVLSAIKWLAMDGAVVPSMEDVTEAVRQTALLRASGQRPVALGAAGHAQLGPCTGAGALIDDSVSPSAAGDACLVRILRATAGHAAASLTPRPDIAPPATPPAQMYRCDAGCSPTRCADCACAACDVCASQLPPAFSAAATTTPHVVRTTPMLAPSRGSHPPDGVVAAQQAHASRLPILAGAAAPPEPQGSDPPSPTALLGLLAPVNTVGGRAAAAGENAEHTAGGWWGEQGGEWVGLGRVGGVSRVGGVGRVGGAGGMQVDFPRSSPASGNTTGSGGGGRAHGTGAGSNRTRSSGSVGSSIGGGGSDSGSDGSIGGDGGDGGGGGGAGGGGGGGSIGGMSDPIGGGGLALGVLTQSRASDRWKAIQDTWISRFPKVLVVESHVDVSRVQQIWK